VGPPVVMPLRKLSLLVNVKPETETVHVSRPFALAIATILLLALVPGRAAIVQRDLDQVGVRPPPNATLPLDLPLQGEDGSSKALRSWLGATPDVLVLADYTCKTLCGPVISIVSDALSHSGLRPGRDFRLVVVGLDPKDTAPDAVRMKQAQVAPEVAEASYILRGDADAIADLTSALGFSSVYDRDRDQFAHPAAAFVIAPDGRVARALPGLGIEPATIRLAIVGAGRGAVGTLTDHIRLLCYGYDPASGTYTVAIGRLLAASSLVTIAALILLIGLLLRRENAVRKS
jgi:protein SCO1/2